MAIFPDEGRVNELAKVAGTGGADLYVRLYTNTVLVDKTLQLAFLVEPTFTGYVPFNSSTWSPPAIDVNDDVFLLSPVMVFAGPSSGFGQNVKGYFVTLGDGIGAKLWFAEAFPTPKALQLPTDLVPLQVQARLRNLVA